MKKALFLTLISYCLLLISVHTVAAQTPSVQTQFPFTINGQTCNTKEECRVLCQDPVNKAACKTLNPGQKPRVDRFADPSFALSASETLGCSTAEGCKVVCSLPANFQKCDQFAQDNQLSGGYDKRIKALSEISDDSAVTDEDVLKLLAIKEELAGTDQTLKEYCDLPEHQAACTTLAEKLGLKGGERLEGPGGCRSPETCRLYCDDPEHFAECKEFEIPGLNNCTSELACYNEFQTEAATLENVLITEDEKQLAGEESSKSEELTAACAGATQGYQGQSVRDLATDLNKSGVCTVLPKSGVPGKNSNCDAYLASGQPFNQEIFEKICEVKPVLPVNGLEKVDTKTAETNLDSYTNWCEDLQSVGQSEASDWQVVPSLCQNFVSTYQKARIECAKSEEDRAEWLTDPVAYSRYCLSAPKKTADYVAACKADPTNCANEGFDWYCSQPGNSCVPLYQGRPVDQAVETFADAGVVKDGEQVTLVLDETTQEFAQEALSEVIDESGATATFNIVDELPEQLSQNAVFVSGTGVNQPSGSRSRTFFQPSAFTTRIVHSLTPVISGELVEDNAQSFKKPWFAVDAFQKDVRPLSQIPLSPEITQKLEKEIRSNQNGWGVVKQNEQKLREISRVKTEENANSNSREKSGFLLPRTDEIRVNVNLFKPQQFIPQPLGTFPNEPIRPLEPFRVEPTGIHSGTSSFTKPSPTRPLETPRPTLINTSGSTGTSGTSGSSPSNTPKLEPSRIPEPTRFIEPTRIPEPTRPPEPTQPPTTSTSGSGSQTTTSNSGSGSTTTTIDPRVQGVQTEEEFWNLVLGVRKSWLGF